MPANTNALTKTNYELQNDLLRLLGFDVRSNILKMTITIEAGELTRIETVEYALDAPSCETVSRIYKLVEDQA